MVTVRYLVEQLNRAYRAGQVQDAEHILELLVAQVTEAPTITATPETIIACAKCHDTGAPEYRLRRVMGRYVLLCVRNGDGCWERSPHPTCSFKDHQGVPCGFPAEARVAYGRDETVTEEVCALHVGASLTPAHGTLTVYPLEV